MVQMGQSPPGETYNAGGIGLPFFQGKAEFGEEYPTRVKWCSQPSRIAEAGDILLSVRAPVGPTNFATERCCIGRGLAAIRSEPTKCNRRYIRYYLKRFETDIAARGVGSTFTAINRHDLEQLELPVPPLIEQERIVRILGEADELRKLRAQADRRTADLIPSLFHDMFGDPETNPKEWPVSALGGLVEAVSGGTPSKERADFWIGAIPWVSPKDMKGPEILDTEDHISERAISETTLKLIQADSVLIVTRGMILAHTVPIRINSVPVTINQDMKALLPRSRVQPVFVRWALQAQHEGLLSQVSSAGHGTKRLETKDLLALQMPVPPLTLQQEFAVRVAEIRAMEAQQAASRRRLDDLFASLLHRAFQGG